MRFTESPTEPPPAPPGGAGCWLALVVLSGLAAIAVITLELLVLLVVDGNLPEPPTRFALVVLFSGALAAPLLAGVAAFAGARYGARAPSGAQPWDDHTTVDRKRVTSK